MNPQSHQASRHTPDRVRGIDRNRFTGSRAESLAGLLIMAMVLLMTLENVLSLPNTDSLRWLASACAWSATLILIRRVTRFLQIQVGILLGIGLTMIAWAQSQKVSISLVDTLSINAGLLSMIAAVGFLRLVALPATSNITLLPVGKQAYWQTLASIGLFGSVINISAPILIADRIHQQRPLNLFTAQSIIRIFCSMSNWSPFFGAMAAVLTYVDQARVDWIVLTCLPFSLLCSVLVYLEARWRHSSRLPEFVGYPLKKEALHVPGILLICVVVFASSFPNLSILSAITICALTVSITILVIRHGIYSMTGQVRNHVTTYLPRMVGELSLFLSAGVFAVGMAALLETGLISSPFTRFDGMTAVQLLGFMLLAAIIGIHPIILISSITPMLLELDPNPTLLAIVYLTSWHLGTCSSYLSGVQLIFQGRYDLPSWKSSIRNWPYSFSMYLIASGWLLALSSFLP